MIWIDCGHGMSNVRPGNYDPGASVLTVTCEAEIVRDVAHEIMLELEGVGGAAGASGQIVGRSPDGYLPDRIKWQGAHVGLDDLVLSLHMNSSGGGHASGTECLFSTTKPELRPLAAELSRRFSEALGLKDRGAKGDDEGQHFRLGILRVPGVRSLLLEMGFLDHPEDLRKVREGAAKALAEILPTLGGVA